MYCFDTNILVDILRGNKELKEKIVGIDKDASIFITPISLCELYKGVFLHSKSEEKAKQVDEVVSLFGLLDFDLDSCKVFGETYRNLKVSGKLIPESDLMIAAITKANDLILITKDKEHFVNTGVRIEAW